MKGKEIFKKDLYRYYGEKGESIFKRIFRPAEIKYIYCMRKAKFSKNILSLCWYKLRLRWISARTHIQIPSVTEIGEGFYIGHTGRLIINSRAKIGKNCNLATGVTIGATSRGKSGGGTPIIGDEVWIGTNAVVVGKINIGDDVLIAPNAYVNFDVPSHSIVIGNPGQIIPRENATDGYINKKV